MRVEVPCARRSSQANTARRRLLVANHSRAVHPRLLGWTSGRGLAPQKKVNMIELVALDVAGTTVDDHGLVYVALGESVRETGASITEADVQQWMGTDKVTAIAGLLGLGGMEPTPATVTAAFERFREILGSAYQATPPAALPGVENALREFRARGIRVALTTGFSDDVALPLLASLGWAVGDGIGNGSDVRIDALVTSSEVALGRPAPYLIQHAMEKTGIVDVATVLAAGDTVVDLLAAHNAGVIGVGVLTGKLSRAELEAHPHHHILPSVVDILTLPEARR
jgi:phosphonatase-like hydrolase